MLCNFPLFREGLASRVASARDSSSDTITQNQLSGAVSPTSSSMCEALSLASSLESRILRFVFAPELLEQRDEKLESFSMMSMLRVFGRKMRVGSLRDFVRRDHMGEIIVWRIITCVFRAPRSTMRLIFNYFVSIEPAN
jgi:hypothetical protein